MSLVFNVSRTLGPALAGVLIAVAGIGGAYVAQAVTYATSVFLTLQLTVGKVDPESERGRSFAASTLAGWRYVAGHQSIRTVLLVMVFTATFGMSFTTLLPVFARDILDVGASGQGLLLTGMGIGALSAAFCVASMGERLPKGAVIISAAGLYGLSVLFFSQSVWFPLSFAMMVAAGAVNVACATVTQTVVQGQSAPDMRGRVMSVYQQTHTLMVIGGILIGALAGVWGSPTTLLVMGATLTIAALVILATMPHVRYIR
jgi:predicted MFS family arabinose efflux permease